MRALFLGRADSPILAHLRTVEDGVAHTSRPLLPIDPRAHRTEFIVSHGYLHMVRPWVLRRFPRRAINLHHSLLPHNRGMDPTLWSFVDDTPKGVTIHYIDEGLDTGEIIAQREVRFTGHETLSDAYWTLVGELASLFEEQWPAIRAGRCSSRPQPQGGSYHRRADRETISHLLTEGGATPVSALTRPSAARPGRR